MKKRLGIIFFLSAALLFIAPPILMSMVLVSRFFHFLGELNATFHSALLSQLGLEASNMGNQILLGSGLTVEYSPYCFGFLTLFAFCVLIFTTPEKGPGKSLKNFLIGGSIILSVNQARIFFELLVGIFHPDSVGWLDILLYPLLPVVAFMLWLFFNGYGPFSLNGGTQYAGG